MDFFNRFRPSRKVVNKQREQLSVSIDDGFYEHPAGLSLPRERFTNDRANRWKPGNRIRWPGGWWNLPASTWSAAGSASPAQTRPFRNSCKAGGHIPSTIWISAAPSGATN